MTHSKLARRPIVALALTLLLLAPAPPVARAGDAPEDGGSVAGIFMAIACGASARVAVAAPAPIVVVVTATVCLFAAVDAWMSPDKPAS
ncbi:MAG: hypothetical protein HZA61_03240 [Candidatus Eisenbacteria bacterium]|uniref:Secreted protein n=1 Tax=Eiseniibacteriota bacterium TaxID=2212470 RepID=A0A933S9K4_UNCEI|nr:hypothetical protein [Candidatus Eisenbacteria bacterium]